MNEWVNDKVCLAERLANGECGGTRDEAILILSAVLSAVATFLWRKKDQTDRKRFVELWARYADENLRPNLVSLPLLVEHLRSTGRDEPAEAARLLREDYLDSIREFDDRVLSGDQVDVQIEIVVRVTNLPIAEVRKFSYGNLFYSYFRSGYVHEYQAGSHGDAVQMSHLRSDVIYDGAFVEAPFRRICFSTEWIMKIVRTTCSNVASDWAERPLPLPTAWWLDGAP